MADPDGRTHSAVCWRGHEDCAEQLLRDAASQLAFLVPLVALNLREHEIATALLARLRAALEE